MRHLVHSGSSNEDGAVNLFTKNCGVHDNLLYSCKHLGQYFDGFKAIFVVCQRLFVTCAAGVIAINHLGQYFLSMQLVVIDAQRGVHNHNPNAQVTPSQGSNFSPKSDAEIRNMDLVLG